MEVHSHSHTPRKKWTHYFWEFLMLFLAVFCGFLAEYQLEHTIEKDREKQYITSLVKDLEYDTLQFNNQIDQLENKIPYFDSVFSFLNNPATYNYELPLKYYLLSIIQDFYTPAEPTIQQLKNSGNLRLLKNKLVLDSILIYDNHLIGSYHDQINYIFLFQNRLITYTEKIFDFANYNQYMSKYKFGESWQDVENYALPLLVKNSSELKELYNQFVDFKVADLYFTYLIKTRKTEAMQLIKFIKKEYHLE